MSEQDSLSAHLSDAAFDNLLVDEHRELIQRISADGAAWRRALPGTETLTRHAYALGAPPSGETAPNMTIREDIHMESANEPSGPTIGSSIPTPQRPPSGGPRFHRARQLAAVVAALVVVALFATVFASQSHQRGRVASPISTANSRVTPTNANSPLTFRPVGKLEHLSGYPVVAPSNPQTVYLLTSGSIQRSADDGNHWVSLPRPSSFPTGMTVSWLDLFVSPLSDATVYATAELSNPDNSQVTNCPAPLPLGHIGAKMTLSGVVPCEAQVVSTNGGDTWSLLRLPINDILGSANANMGTANQFNQFSAPLQTQGTLLYSLASLGPVVGNVSDRIVGSADGVTWRTVDDGLVARGLSACQYAATPTGKTLFAVTASSCDLISGAAQQLWRSDDSGASWRQVTLPPGRTVVAMTAAGGAQSRLFLVDPILNNQPHTFSLTIGPSDFKVSADGGQTWQSAPTAGIPAGMQSASSAVAVLGDGRLAAAFQSAPAMGIYAWQPDAATWVKLGDNDTTVGVVSLDTVGGSGGNTLWVTVVDGQSANQPTYTVLGLAP